MDPRHWNSFQIFIFVFQISFKNHVLGLLAVQGLRIRLPVQGMWPRSLVVELRLHKPWATKATSWNQRSLCTATKIPCATVKINVVTNTFINFLMSLLAAWCFIPLCVLEYFCTDPTSNQKHFMQHCFAKATSDFRKFSGPMPVR